MAATSFRVSSSILALLKETRLQQAFGSSVLQLQWLGSRVVSVLDSDTEGPGFKSQPRRCRVTVSGKLFTPIVLLFTEQRNW